MKLDHALLPKDALDSHMNMLLRSILMHGQFKMTRSPWYLHVIMCNLILSSCCQKVITGSPESLKNMIAEINVIGYIPSVLFVCVMIFSKIRSYDYRFFFRACTQSAI